MSEISKNKKENLKKQKKQFNKRLTSLLKKDLLYSMRYEDSLVKEDGKAYVNVDLTKLDSPFSVFSYEKRINPEIYDFIDSAVFYLNVSIPVVINFDDGGKYNDELKEKITKSVIRHYSLKYEDKKIEHKNSIIFGLLMFFVGIFVLLWHFIFDYYKIGGDIFNEISLITSWMFIWTSVDLFFVNGHSKRIDIFNAGQLALAEITFGEPKK